MNALWGHRGEKVQRWEQVPEDGDASFVHNLGWLLASLELLWNYTVFRDFADSCPFKTTEHLVTRILGYFSNLTQNNSLFCHGITELQNSWSWKGLLEVIMFKAYSIWDTQSWLTSKMFWQLLNIFNLGALQYPWKTYATAFSPQEIVFSCSKAASYLSGCVQCIFPAIGHHEKEPVSIIASPFRYLCIFICLAEQSCQVFFLLNHLFWHS